MRHTLFAAALSGLLSLQSCSESSYEEADPADVDAAVDRAEIKKDSAREAAATNQQN